MALIHVFLDNSWYFIMPDCCSNDAPGPCGGLSSISSRSYCAHLNPIERLSSLMHRNVTDNQCYATCAQFADATRGFLRETVPGNWSGSVSSVTQDFRVIIPEDFRLIT